MNIRVTLASLLVATSAFASAQLDLGTTDASDGDLNVNYNGSYVFDLGAAATGAWDSPSPVPGKGVYDPAKWVVVYKFNDFSLNYSNVYFSPHPSKCPVIFLVQGNATSYGSNFYLASQVGGFGGGLMGASGFAPHDGLGPGGGKSSFIDGILPGAGSYATAGTSPNSGATYGNPAILPLIGGSGSGVRAAYGQAGFAGGGALLLACRNSFVSSSNFQAKPEWSGDGNRSPGSGGAIKIMAHTLNMLSANIDASGTLNSGQGRIRLEANSFVNLPTCTPSPSTATAGPTAKIFATSLTPKTTITKVGGLTAPSDPRGNFTAIPDINLNAAGTQAVEVTCENIPVDGSWSVFVRGVPRNGESTTYTANYATGNLSWSTWTVNVPFTEGNQVLQVRAKKN